MAHCGSSEESGTIHQTDATENRERGIPKSQDIELKRSLQRHGSSSGEAPFSRSNEVSFEQKVEPLVESTLGEQDIKELLPEGGHVGKTRQASTNTAVDIKQLPPGTLSLGNQLATQTAADVGSIKVVPSLPAEDTPGVEDEQRDTESLPEIRRGALAAPKRMPSPTLRRSFSVSEPNLAARDATDDPKGFLEGCDKCKKDKTGGFSTNCVLYSRKDQPKESFDHNHGKFHCTGLSKSQFELERS